MFAFFLASTFDEKLEARSLELHTSNLMEGLIDLIDYLA
jgi:hypothetical protein